MSLKLGIPPTGLLCYGRNSEEFMPRPTRPASTTRYALWLSRRPDDVRTLAALLCPTLPFAALATRALGLPVSSDDPYA